MGGVREEERGTWSQEARREPEDRETRKTRNQESEGPVAKMTGLLYREGLGEGQLRPWAGQPRDGWADKMTL